MEYIVDQNTYVLAKNSKKENVTNKEIHDVLFKIMCEFDRICRKHQIGYALAFGSALGIYNYGNFIPWDDDVDIVIDYFDRLRLIEALKEDLGEDFSFECYETNDKYNILIPGLKVRYKHSEIKEKNHFRLPNRVSKNNGLFIDVVFMMGLPEEKTHKKLLRKAFWKMPLYVFLDAFLHIDPKNMKKRMKTLEEKVATENKNSEIIGQSVIMPFQIFPLRKEHQIRYPKAVIYPFKEYEFNGKKFYSFNMLKEFCILMYGEKSLKVKNDSQYIDPFPPQNRKSDHLLKVDIYKK